jgi:hypothetical protein
MAKITDAQRKQIDKHLADPRNEPLPEGVEINFGDPDPFRKRDQGITSQSTVNDDEGQG